MSPRTTRPFRAYLEGMCLGIVLGSVIGTVISLLTLT